LILSTAIFAVVSAGPSNGAMNPVCAIAAPMRIGLSQAAEVAGAADADEELLVEVQPVATSATMANTGARLLENFIKTPLSGRWCFQQQANHVAPHWRSSIIRNMRNQLVTKIS